jgi:hypothetical protein
MTASPTRSVLATVVLLVLLSRPFPSLAAEPIPGFAGDWVVNQELSDDTDKKVEEAIRAAGGRPDSGGRTGRGRYRGGPPEQELYDRMAYDDVLTIRLDPPQVTFTYADGFERSFYTDGRGRSVSARGESRDYSFADWSDTRLFVEGRPRDGGWTREEYSLQAGGNRLRAELHMQPLTFMKPISIIRVYDRKGTQPKGSEE